MVDRAGLLGRLSGAIGGLGTNFGNGQPFGATSPFSTNNPFGGMSAFTAEVPFGSGQAFGTAQPFGQGQPFSGNQPFGNSQAFGASQPFGNSQPFGGGAPFGGSPFNLAPSFAPQEVATSTLPDAGGDAGGPSAGLKPEVAKWAQQTRDTFGDLGADMPDVMLAIMTNESGGNPDIKNPGYPAYGLFQLVGYGANLTPEQQFRAAHELAQQKLKSITDAYAANGISPDARTRARDFALAWAGHFNYKTGLPNPDSADIVSGQSAAQLSAIFLANYDAIKAGRTASAGTGKAMQTPSAAANRAQGVIGAVYTNGGIRNVANAGNLTAQQVLAAGVDCSSLTGWALGLSQQAGLWNAQAQYDASKRVDRSQLQAGDLLFWQGTTTGDASARPVTHVGIYLGSGKMLHAGDNGVEIVDINNSYWDAHYWGAGRF